MSHPVIIKMCIKQIDQSYDLWVSFHEVLVTSKKISDGFYATGGSVNFYMIKWIQFYKGPWLNMMTGCH